MDLPDLLHALPDESPKPPAVDITRAMRDGRRNRRRRRLATAAAVGLAVLAVVAVPAALAATRDPNERPPVGTTPTPAPTRADPSAPPSGPARALPALAPVTSCRTEHLAIPDKVPQALVTAADPTGRLIVGITYLPGGQHRGVLWVSGNPATFTIPGTDPGIRSLNAAGLGVGMSYDDDGQTSAWLYRAGDKAVTLLPSGGRAVANSINAKNMIAGSTEVGDASPQGAPAHLRVPVVWRTPESDPERLPLPSGARGGNATAVDDDGTVVGTITTAGNVSAAYVWAPDGTGRRLPPPPAPTGGWPSRSTGAGLPVGTDASTQYSNAGTIHDGWVVGRVGTFNRTLPVRWDLHSGAVDLLGAEDAIGWGTGNPAGWFVGFDAEQRPILLFPGGRRLSLPLVFTHVKGNTDHIATTISDDGRTIAGQANGSDGVIKPIVWRCT